MTNNILSKETVHKTRNTAKLQTTNNKPLYIYMITYEQTQKQKQDPKTQTSENYEHVPVHKGNSNETTEIIMIRTTWLLFSN